MGSSGETDCVDKAAGTPDSPFFLISSRPPHPILEKEQGD